MSSVGSGVGGLPRVSFRVVWSMFLRARDLVSLLSAARPCIVRWKESRALAITRRELVSSDLRMGLQMPLNCLWMGSLAIISLHIAGVWDFMTVASWYKTDWAWDFPWNLFDRTVGEDSFRLSRTWFILMALLSRFMEAYLVSPSLTRLGPPWKLCIEDFRV